jgi:hypothetical protein
MLKVMQPFSSFRMHGLTPSASMIWEMRYQVCQVGEVANV